MKTFLSIFNAVLLIIIILLVIKRDVFRPVGDLLSGIFGRNEYHYLDNQKYKTDSEKFMLFNRQADIVMLGNSITAGIDWNELLRINDIVNRGINGDITEGMLNRINSVLKVKPKICFFLGGINDLTRRVPYDETFENIKRIMDILLENDIEPVLQSIIYTNSDFYDYKHNNRYVRIFNEQLKDYADEKGILFLDLNEQLSVDGMLKKIYSYDGLHLNAEGYVVWGRVVKNTIDNLQLTIKFKR